MTVEQKMENLQANLKPILQHLGWTQAYLGEKLDVSRQMMNALLNGKTKFNKRHFLAICYVVGQAFKLGEITQEQFEIFNVALEKKISGTKKTIIVTFE